MCRIPLNMATRGPAASLALAGLALGRDQQPEQDAEHDEPQDHGDRDPALAELPCLVAHPDQREAEHAGRNQCGTLDPRFVAGLDLRQRRIERLPSLRRRAVTTGQTKPGPKATMTDKMCSRRKSR